MEAVSISQFILCLTAVLSFVTASGKLPISLAGIFLPLFSILPVNLVFVSAMILWGLMCYTVCCRLSTKLLGAGLRKSL